MFDPETHPSVPTLRTTKAARRRSGQKRGHARGTGRFFALSLGKKYRTRLLIRDGARGRTRSRKAGLKLKATPLPRPPLPSKSKTINPSWLLWLPVGMWAKASISPSLRSKTGEAQPFG